ncbi:MAG: 4-(cytidine 5'-diphospho)-2-C-methyl-D-erythritol kinase [Planctomycetaceae bacterium]|nr:4-(cytidine 5'-diphospho)-2-C-methyl-D-erythritol kinase [Planctomycetaceae bacterium]
MGCPPLASHPLHTMTRLGVPDPLAVYPTFYAGQNAILVAAPAKLNLFLEILNKRADGYHDLESLMLTVDLYDTLEIRGNSSGAISLVCDTPGVPTGPENLVLKATTALQMHVNRLDLGASIRLTKRIPMQAGLAGGSTDAAIALLGLNEIWKLALTREELAVIASSVGSDVAFFLTPPAGWCVGRGEVVTPEPVGRTLDFVVVCPSVGLATADVYRKLAVPASPVSGEPLRAAVRLGDPTAVGRALFNRLEEPAFALSPKVEVIRNRLAGVAPCGARMSGSGSAVFAVCRDRAEATRVAAAFRNADPGLDQDSRIFVVRSLAP